MTTAHFALDTRCTLPVRLVSLCDLPDSALGALHQLQG
jgi:hypothetical protein